MSSSIYDIEVATAQGEALSLAEYKGDVLLIVNVASQCGYTRQYEGLEKLYQSYKDKGFKILAFPANNFGQQEPGSMEEILQFCSTNYGVSFDIFEKVEAKGEAQHPLYQWLTSQASPAGEVAWNFEKFLISKDGQILGRFPSKVAPEDAELIESIEKSL